MLTAANGLFFTAYHTDFSKINHTAHGGKELGWMHIFQSLGLTLGPLIGGIIASLFSPGWTFTVSIVVLFVSLVPLFFTKEPIKVHQKLDFSAFKPSLYIRDYISVSALNLTHLASASFWPLLLAIFIFDGDVYAKVGVLVALSTIISVFSARMFGKFVDNKKGLYLLRYGTIMLTLGSFLRSIITTSSGALALSMVNEPSFLSVQLPLQKNFYDAADSVPESNRILYIAWAEIIGALVKLLFCTGLFVASYFFDPIHVLRVSFIVAGLATPLMLMQRFPGLKRV